MADLEPARRLPWQHAFAAVLLFGGIALIALSFIWASVSSRDAAWSQEQAHDYQAAAIKLHGLSHQFAHEQERGNEESVRPELGKAQAEFDALRGQLENAMARPRRIALVLRFGGLFLIAVGAVSLYLGSPANRRQES